MKWAGTAGSDRRDDTKSTRPIPGNRSASGIDASGKTIYQPQRTAPVRVISEKTAAVMNEILKAVVARGRTQRARHDDEGQHRDERARSEPERPLERLELDDPLGAAPRERRLEPCVQRLQAPRLPRCLERVRVVGRGDSSRAIGSDTGTLEPRARSVITRLG